MARARWPGSLGGCAGGGSQQRTQPPRPGGRRTRTQSRAAPGWEALAERAWGAWIRASPGPVLVSGGLGGVRAGGAPTEAALGERGCVRRKPPSKATPDRKGLPGAITARVRARSKCRKGTGGGRGGRAQILSGRPADSGAARSGGFKARGARLPPARAGRAREAADALFRGAPAPRAARLRRRCPRPQSPLFRRTSKQDGAFAVASRWRGPQSQQGSCTGCGRFCSPGGALAIDLTPGQAQTCRTLQQRDATGGVRGSAGTSVPLVCASSLPCTPGDPDTHFHPHKQLPRG